MPAGHKVIVVMPAYNAGKTLRLTYEELPKDKVDLVILVDDGSSDDTIHIARQLNLELFVHDRNYGYGANQKTCYREALKAGGTIIVMVHPDYQYDPRLLPDLVQPLLEDRAEVVLGSRLLGMRGIRHRQGMPWWKYLGNRFLTTIQNTVFGLRLSEYHTGYRAFHRHVLETVNLAMDSDSFVFDQEIIAQIVAAGFRIAEVPVPVKYFPEASTASFLTSVRYGLSILWLLFRYLLHKKRFVRFRQLESLPGRYRHLVAEDKAEPSRP